MFDKKVSWIMDLCAEVARNMYLHSYIHTYIFTSCGREGGRVGERPVVHIRKDDDHSYALGLCERCKP